MLGTLVQGRVCVSGASISATKSALTIAVRYGLHRRQFGPPGEHEVQILDYRTHQRLLMPLLAKTYALHFAQQELSAKFHHVFSAGRRPIVDDGRPQRKLRSHREDRRFEPVGRAVSDLGAPVSYEVLARHTPVLSSDGEEIGTVEHVLAAEAQDIFDGIVIKRQGHGHLLRHAFADAEQIATIHERGVTLTLTAAESERLPEPSANPVAMRDDPAAPRENTLARKLSRAWDLLSGKY
jgi:hypothetical protein